MTLSGWRLPFCLGSAIAAQSAVGLFVVGAVPVIFYQNGVSLADFWLFAFIGVPGWTKWMWAPIVDRLARNRRRAWIFWTTLLGALVLVPIAWIAPDETGLLPIIALIVGHRFIYATNDINVDAYCVEQLDERDHANGTAAIVIGDNLGYLLAYGILLSAYGFFGWPIAVAAALSIYIVGNLPILLRTERPILKASDQPPAGAWGVMEPLIALLRRPEAPAMLLLMVTSGFAMQLIWTGYGPALADQGFSMSAIGLTLGFAAAAAGLCGSGIAASASRRFGYISATMRLLPLFLISGALSLLLAGVVTLSTFAIFLIVFGIEFLRVPLWNFLFEARLRWTEPGSAGTEFSVQSGVQYAGKSATNVIIGPLAAAGWVAYFSVQAVFLAAFCILFIWLARHVEHIRARQSAAVATAARLAE